MVEYYAHLCAWNGGTQFDPYPFEFNDELKEDVRRRDNYTCQECSKCIAGQVDEMCIHHIAYDKQNCDSDNLLLLCRGCHDVTNQKSGVLDAAFSIKEILIWICQQMY